jgi:hypothetical protein
MSDHTFIATGAPMTQLQPDSFKICWGSGSRAGLICASSLALRAALYEMARDARALARSTGNAVQTVTEELLPGVLVSLTLYTRGQDFTRAAENLLAQELS